MKYRIDGMIEVGFSFEIEADDEEDAYEKASSEVEPSVVLGDNGRMLTLRGAGLEGRKFWVDGCFPAVDHIEEIGE